MDNKSNVVSGNHIAKNKQIDVQPGKHKWIPDVAFLKWKGF